MASSKELRRAEAEQIRALDPATRRQTLGERTWTARFSWWALSFFIVAAPVGLLLVVDGLSWGITGRQVFMNPDGPPPDFAGWVALVCTVGVGAVLIIVPIFLALANRRGAWMRLDTKGFAYRGTGFLRAPDVEQHDWADCSQFRVARSAGAEGGFTLVARCIVADSVFDVDEGFGKPADVVVVLNAYRNTYGQPPTPSPEQPPTPSRAILEDKIFRASRRRFIPAMVVFSLSGFGLAAMFSGASDATPTQRITYALLILVPICTFLGSLLYRSLNPAWLRADSTGFTIGGARRGWPTPQQKYRWEDCGPFAAIQLDAPWLVRCTVGGRTLTIRGDDYGYTGDLAHTLNSYRAAFRSTELS